MYMNVYILYISIYAYQTDGQRTTTATTGHDGTDGERTDDDDRMDGEDRTDDGTDGRTEDDNGDDGTDTTGQKDDLYGSKDSNTLFGPIF